MTGDRPSSLSGGPGRILRQLSSLVMGSTIAYADELGETLQEGDLVIFKGKAPHDCVIRCCTNSSFNHVAMVVRVRGELQLFEATMAGVGVCPLEFYIDSYWWTLMRRRFHKVVVRQLHTKGGRGLTQAMRADLMRYVSEMYGRSFQYNPLEYMRILLNLKHDVDMNNVFCSQLVAGAYQRMGLLSADRPMDSFLPADFAGARGARLALLDGARLGHERVVVFEERPVPPQRRPSYWAPKRSSSSPMRSRASLGVVPRHTRGSVIGSSSLDIASEGSSELIDDKSSVGNETSSRTSFCDTHSRQCAGSSADGSLSMSTDMHMHMDAHVEASAMGGGCTSVAVAAAEPGVATTRVATPLSTSDVPLTVGDGGGSSGPIERGCSALTEPDQPGVSRPVLVHPLRRAFSARIGFERHEWAAPGRKVARFASAVLPWTASRHLESPDQKMECDAERDAERVMARALAVYVLRRWMRRRVREFRRRESAKALAVTIGITAVSASPDKVHSGLSSLGSSQAATSSDWIGQGPSFSQLQLDLEHATQAHPSCAGAPVA